MKYNSSDEALRSLARKGIFAKGTALYIPEHPHGVIGNKTYGTLDYLVNYCNYTVIDQRKDEESKGKIIKASRFTGSSKRDLITNPFTNPGRKWKRVTTELKFRLNNYEANTSSRGGHQYHRPGSMQM